MATLAEVADYLDTTLNVAAIPDYPGAMNGVQLGTTRGITQVATAVDFASYTAHRAIEAGAQLLIVHHGMFWGGAQPIVGRAYERLKALLAAGVGVYASHLPLDVHPELGNNALLARELGLSPSGGFARFQTIDVGVSGECELATHTLVERATAFAAQHGGQTRTTPFDAGRVTRRWGICTGAGASSETLREAESRGIDTVIVGEGPHHTAVAARDVGLTVVYAGHYATETLGVRALGDALTRRFGVPSTFIDAPTGL
jgi:dinuclear metal center YbgI/SA1388 family protein